LETTTPEQLALFDVPPSPRFIPRLKPIGRPIWTENKAKLIERYLYYFVLVTKHGNYIDGFAGPQQPEKPETWAAKLVLEIEPKRLRKFFLFDNDPGQADRLQRLKCEADALTRGEESARIIEAKKADFNKAVHGLLASGQIGEAEATFCLLDQRTFECRWSTLEALAKHHKRRFKIELFYFIPMKWIDRALAAQRDRSVIEAWWGRQDWQELRNRRGQERAQYFCERVRNELDYNSVLAWPIRERSSGGSVMYYMLHATDHPVAPNLMSRAYRQAVSPKEDAEQFSLEFHERMSVNRVAGLD
jgi:three-Cys-motif partner protein